MPALYCCGRRWRTSTDDFTFSGIFFFALLIVSGIVALTRFEGGVGNINECPNASVKLSRSFFTLGILNIISAILFIITAGISCRGGPFQVHKRRHIPLMLYILTIFILIILVCNSLVTKYSIYDYESKTCTNPTRYLIHLVIGLNFLVIAAYFFMFIIVFDPDGHRNWNNSEEYESLWGQRCRWLCCSCLKSPREDDAFQDVAKTLAGLFRGYDLVPSDIVAGMLILHGMQQGTLRSRQFNLHFPPPEDNYAERISLQAKRFPILTLEQRQQIMELGMYSRFYMSAYGWPLYEYMHCCLGLPKLCCFDPLMCCRKHPDVHRGTTLYCDVTALLKITGISEQDIILTSWENTLFRPVFFIVNDRSTNAIILSIRGTMSFADCVTDLVATPGLLHVPEKERSENTTPDDYYVHGGMKQSAEYILRELQEAGIIQSIINGEFKRHKFIILGHSLGAGVATLLSIMIRLQEPILASRIRCLAYAPPGGLLSPALVEFSKNFVIGCFAGNDVIPRMATHTFDNLRESIFDALMNFSSSKSLLFMNIFRTEKITRIKSSSLNSQNVFGTSSFRPNITYSTSSTPLENERKLFPPATLVHYCKAVVRGKCMCCIVPSHFCCRCYDEIFVPIFETHKDVQMVVCSPSMFKDHFPDRLFKVIEETEKRLKNGELERFFFPPEVMEVESIRCDYGSLLNGDPSSVV